MAVVFVVLFRDRSLIGVFAGLLVSGPLYLAFGAMLAKFGYQRKSLERAPLRARPNVRAASVQRAVAARRSATAAGADQAHGWRQPATGGPQAAPSNRLGRPRGLRTRRERLMSTTPA